MEKLSVGFEEALKKPQKKKKMGNLKEIKEERS